MVQIIKGDEVSIRGVVDEVVHSTGRIFVTIINCDDREQVVAMSRDSPQITYYPKPREIKAGSIVRHKSQDGQGETQEILFRDREDCVYRGYRCLMTVNVNQLEWVGQREDAKA